MTKLQNSVLFLILAGAIALLCGCRSAAPESTTSVYGENPLHVTIHPAILEKNPCYTANRKIKVKGLMLHSVGCSQPSAEVFVNRWNSPNYNRACVHGFIDGRTGVVWQTLPWDHFGWHSGRGPNGNANQTHIGVEMCESEVLRYVGGATFKCDNPEEARKTAERTYDAAVNLFAYLCWKYNLNPVADGVIISHNEGRLRGIASGHHDPEHLWRQLDMIQIMDKFRADVKAQLVAYRAFQANGWRKFKNKWWDAAILGRNPGPLE